MSSTLPPGTARRRDLHWAAAAAVLMTLALAGCSTSPSTATTNSSGGATINVVAAENFWGSLAEQLGGTQVKVTSIINNPDADPHDYEATAADGRAIAAAKLAIINGVGYDAWATKLADANPSSARTSQRRDLAVDVGGRVVPLHHRECQSGRAGARCWPCGQSVSPTRPPNPPCASQRNGLSTCLTRWSAQRRLPGSGARGSVSCCRGSGSGSPRRWMRR